LAHFYGMAVTRKVDANMGQAPLPPAADARRIESVAAAINVGYADHVLLAHEVCTKAQLKRNGGGGYTYISNVILPWLKANDLRKIEICGRDSTITTRSQPKVPVPVRLVGGYAFEREDTVTLLVNTIKAASESLEAAWLI
jgi:hypothetical protein